jgi:uncharacterized protein (TIGR03435 family)
MTDWAIPRFKGKTKPSRLALDAILCAMFFVVGSVPSGAQPSSVPQPSDKPQFEVASVKPCDSHSVVGTNAGTTSPGRVAYNCQNLMNYIRTAYGTWGSGSDRPAVGPFNIVGGPAWINTELYQINAKSEGSARRGTTAGPMMQALLEDRFKLKIHRETREVPVYALVLTKAGLKLPAAKVECWAMDFGRPFTPPKEGQPPPQRCGFGQRTKDGVEVHGSTMTEFCVALAHTPLRIERRKFVDKTGITGRFDFDLKFPDELTEGESAPEATQTRYPTDDLVRLQDALYKVGLQLKSEKGQDEFIVIDRAERPTAN